MLYPKNFEQKIGFNEIRNLLYSHCLSEMGKERVSRMEFQTSANVIRQLHQQVQEFISIVDERTDLPEQDFFDLRESIQHIRIEGTFLEEQEMWNLLRSLNTLHSWIEIVREQEEGEPSHYPALEKIAEGVFTFYSVTRRIEQILDKYGKIKDEASPELTAIRREMRAAEGSVSRALNSILRSAKEEGMVEKDVTPTLRDGRLVIPVVPAMKRKLKGIVHDESATGKTIYIEPAEVVEANNLIRELEYAEKREINRILREFAAIIRPNVKELLRGFDFLSKIEFIRAKAFFSKQIGGISPDIVDDTIMDWIMAKHPLLELALKKQGKEIVPLDVELNKRQRILIISGPNAGGKSVCLKTIGLLQYMVQCGLPVPMRENSHAGIFQHFFIDIGDEQSIEDDLSTYSGHLLNMKNMMQWCGSSSLLLIDEFGGGTEPTIGGALAESMLRRFVVKGAYGVITTHYQNLKQFAVNTPGVVNGAMLYDRQKMQALFQLQIGNPGSSFAVEIARKIGIPEDVIEDATELVGQEYVNADKYLLDISRDKRYWENKRQTIHAQEKQMEETIRKYEQEIADLRAKRKDIIQAAKNQAENILQNSNAIIENTIREIRENQAEKERTKEARQQLDDFKTNLDTEQKQEKDELIEKKMRQIQDRKKRKEERKNKKEQEENHPHKNPSVDSTVDTSSSIAEGDSVRLKGQTTVGIVEKLDGRKAIVTFGVMRTVVKIERLEHAEPPQKEQEVHVASYLSKETQDHVRAKHLQFQQDIDVRGMRGDEALQAVTYFIDDAILVGASRVRILHGTGNGILRQLIRQYLHTIPSVRDARDEHIQFGGAGITVVELS